jgi:hypothetical protein
VVVLVLAAQALEDELGLLDGGLADLDGLEATLEGLVLLDVLAVLVYRGRADDLDLTARERRLEDGGGVYRALGGARPDEVVDLVYEQDDVAVVGDLLHYLLEALLELAAVLGAGDERAEVKGVNLFVTEDLGYTPLGYLLGKPLDDGGLADPRLADDDGVVLGAPHQDLHDPGYLLAPPDNGVELVLLGVRREVAPVLVELAGLGPLGLDAPTAGLAATAAAPAAAAAEHPHDLAADLVRVDVEVGENAGRDALALAHEPEQDVLGADVVVAELERLAQRELQYLLGARGERRLGAGALFTVTDDRLDLLAHLVEGDVQGGQGAGGDPLVLAQEAKEEVLGADVVVVEVPGLFLGKDHDLPGPFREPFEH